MGKKNKKKIDQMEFNRGLMNYAGDGGGSKEAKELLERYNVESYRHGRTDRGSEYRGFDEIKQDLSDAMMNDYDTRRTIEAAAMAGNKDAKKFAKNGIEGAKSMLGAHQLMKDLKKEYVGGGGMNGAENRASLTYAAVNADRDALMEDFKGMIPEVPEDTNTADNVEEKKEIVLSEHMQKAKERVDAFEGGNMNIFASAEGEDAQKTGDSPLAPNSQKAAGINAEINIDNVGKSSEERAQDFLKDKTDKVKGEFRFSRVY